MFLIQNIPPVWTAARPRQGEWLQSEIEHWQAAGVAHVVSLLTPAENAALGLLAEAEKVRALGLRFSAIPIRDRQTPSSSRAFHAALAPARSSLSAGQGVLVHCRQGIGRASLTAAALLLAGGQSPDLIWDHIAQVRGRPVPDTPEQRRWLSSYAAYCALIASADRPSECQ